MENSLVPVEGADNYMDIELYMGLHIKSDTGLVIDRFDDFGEPPKYGDINFPSIVLSRAGGGYKQSKLSRSLTLFSITYNFILRKVEEKINNQTLDKMKERFWRLRTRHGNRSKYLTRLRRKILFQKLENEKVAGRIIKNSFGDLFNLLPERYRGVKDDAIQYYSITFLLKSALINAKGLSYLEQQNDLGRINLNDDSLILLQSLKDLMSYRQENATFDDYINNWIKELLK